MADVQDRRTAATDAFSSKDGHSSILAHQIADHTENHGEEGSEYIKSLVYGGLDGIVTTFAVVAAGVGAGESVATILLFGFAGVVADGISMGLGDYFSSLSELEFALVEKKREEWEYDNHQEGECAEMIALYQKKHDMSAEDATAIMQVYSKYKEPFIDLMLVEELGLQAPDLEERSKAWKNGLVTLFSFWGFGSISLVAFLLLLAGNVNDIPTLFAVATLAVLVSLFALGVVKANFTQQSKFRSGFYMVLNGTVASLAAFVVGMLMDSLIATDACPDGCVPV
jgi:DNA damage-binding protein 1